MHIFVTGASGFIGSVFIRLLQQRIDKDDSIILLLRSGILPETVSDDSRISIIKGDLESIRSTQQIKESLLKCEYVFHIAANATFGNNQDYEKTNYLPTKDIVDVLKHSKKLKNFIFLSTIGAFDRHKRDLCKSPITNESIPSPQSDYGRSKLLAEEYIIKSGIPYTIIRPTWVYGRNMRLKSHINLFVNMINRKSIITQINFPGKVSLIHVDDLARSLVQCIDNSEVIGKKYFAETENKSFGEIFRIINKKVNHKDGLILPVPNFGTKFFISHMHPLLPLQINNLFIDYLYAKDDSYKRDLLKKVTLIKFQDGVDDVISTNALSSGYWVITGANSGIGFALAKKLHNLGKKLILIDKDIGNLAGLDNPSKKHKAENKYPKKNALYRMKDREIIVIKADLSVKSDIYRVVKEIQKHTIRCLVNNAGIGFRKKFNDHTIEDIDRIIAVNVQSHVLITRMLLDKLKKEGSSIVNIASSIAYNPLPNMSMYSSTKAFISNWSESLTYELKDTNNIITFSPSGTNTNFQKNAGVKKEKDGKGLKTPEYVADKIIESVEKNKTVVILDFKTNMLLLVSKFLPRKFNILFWGKLFEKMR